MQLESQACTRLLPCPGSRGAKGIGRAYGRWSKGSCASCSSHRRMAAVAPQGPFGGCAVLLSQPALSQPRICLQAQAVHLLIPLHVQWVRCMGLCLVPCTNRARDVWCTMVYGVRCRRFTGALTVPCMQLLPWHLGILALQAEASGGQIQLYP